MDLLLSGKRALVTGSSSGLGVAMAKALAAEGVSVVVHGRDMDRTAKTVAEIVAAGGRAVAAIGNLSLDEEAEAVGDVAMAEFGGIDILVNNAGGAFHNHENATWHDLEPQEYLDSLNINLVAAVRLSRRFVPGMCERRWGRVINISSTAGRQALGTLHEYGPSKAAVENWSLNLSKNLAEFGVTVNTIAPGMVLTAATHRFLVELGKERGWSTDMDVIQRRYADEAFPQPIKRLGKPEEIGAAVTFLASPLSDYTTGAVWRVDGGGAVYV